MRISDKFEELKSRNEGALISYICAGDPSTELTKSAVEALVRGGADIIELGLPFSDPCADGPVIQSATDRAISAGMTPDRYFELVSTLQVDIPLVCMTYYNIIYKRGIEKFIEDCSSSGITGLIVPDLPVEESDELGLACEKNEVDLIFLIAPTTNKKRLQKILSKSTGFLYMVSRTGVTGGSTDINTGIADLLTDIKKCANIPIAVGFGISNRNQVVDIISYGADGVIAGSAFVDIIASGKNVEHRLESLVFDLKSGCKE
ncbi:tryptophan synthase, alpha subunit [Methanosalsum zhilinae DSM 4017]|uniref:Tryptophan synthase alpha chain n=1 Tax=Methanosalsum zhilinae (strain DSM 4017 / NBRC 107636 / OCM 62 / WeN5) TaxID=679901 RepID=F7XQ49_METZD|nr:tryptophan synthase subunit alpha [Methanosalsum zhilinae]AEH60410.1 tryptophan synthase, alpha subunit [Methanosalsum zhilinae DSM 4017]